MRGWSSCGGCCRGMVRWPGSIWGEDKQALAVVDHDGRVVWRRTVRVKAHQLGGVLDDAVAAGGHARVTVACEPAGV